MPDKISTSKSSWLTEPAFWFLALFALLQLIVLSFAQGTLNSAILERNGDGDSSAARSNNPGLIKRPEAAPYPGFSNWARQSDFGKDYDKIQSERHQYYDEHRDLRVVTLSSPSDEDLEQIIKLPRLTQLYLYFNRLPESSIKILRKVKFLDKLDLQIIFDNQACKLNSWNLKNVKSISLCLFPHQGYEVKRRVQDCSAMPVFDLGAIPKDGNIEQLTLVAGSLSNPENLKGLSGLRRLTITVHELSSSAASEIASLPHLDTLCVWSDICDLGAVEALLKSKAKTVSLYPSSLGVLTALTHWTHANKLIVRDGIPNTITVNKDGTFDLRGDKLAFAETEVLLNDSPMVHKLEADSRESAIFVGNYLNSHKLKFAVNHYDDNSDCWVFDINRRMAPSR